MKLHHILFILWAIFFTFWLVGQFSRFNKRKGPTPGK